MSLAFMTLFTEQRRKFNLIVNTVRHCAFATGYTEPETTVDPAQCHNNCLSHTHTEIHTETQTDRQTNTDRQTDTDQ